MSKRCSNVIRNYQNSTTERVSLDVFSSIEKCVTLFYPLSDALQQGASQFEQQAGKLKRKFWLQNLKV
jgi:Synaptobrevin